MMYTYIYIYIYIYIYTYIQLYIHFKCITNISCRNQINVISIRNK